MSQQGGQEQGVEVGNDPAAPLRGRNRTAGDAAWSGSGVISASTPITLFAIPKPFVGDADRIQCNAINSWTRLRPAMEVVLLGDDPGTRESAAELGVAHISGVRTNARGTPLLGSAFSLIQRFSNSPILVYCNCDVILMPDFVEALELLIRSPMLERFVAIGRRTDVQLDEKIDFENSSEIDRLLNEVGTKGKPGPFVCKEYFAFTRSVFSEIPEFAVGRGNWDNWMVAEARRMGCPVVNIGSRAQAIHQSHGYTHAKASRMDCYVTGEEAQENQKLAKGRNLIKGSSATWELGKNGLQRKRFPGLNADFWLDLPRFLKLLGNLMSK